MKKQLSLSSVAIFFAILFLSVACKKESSTDDTPPASTTVDGGATLTTAEANTVTCASAVLGGTISSIGACTITEHGVVIGTSSNPTVSQTKITDTTISGTGSFSVLATALAQSTTYYVRAYATNCKGTNYGNEIHFTTSSCGGGGGGGADTGWFKLTVDGVVYFSYDFYSPASAIVFPEGDTRQMTLGYDSANSAFGITGGSSRYYDPTASFGFFFQYENTEVNSEGTYTFNKSTSEKTEMMILRTGTGPYELLTNPNCNIYSSEKNYSRYFDTSCHQTELSYAVTTLTITHWAYQFGFVEGTIIGTMYEDTKAETNCSNSLAKPFTAEFKLLRVH